MECMPHSVPSDDGTPTLPLIPRRPSRTYDSVPNTSRYRDVNTAHSSHSDGRKRQLSSTAKRCQKWREEYGRKSSTWISAGNQDHTMLSPPMKTFLYLNRTASSVSRGLATDASDNKILSAKSGKRLSFSDVSLPGCFSKPQSVHYFDSNFNSDIDHPKPWKPPKVSKAQYEKTKEKLLKEGKFKEALKRYFKLDKQPWEKEESSDDDGYDTDLDKQLGLELIIDEKSRDIIREGTCADYKYECRKFRSNPNSYFLRHSLDENLSMRHRYLSKGDCITMSNHIKDDLTMTHIDLEDNGIGPTGAKYVKNILLNNQYLVHLNLAGNNIGPLGVKYLKTAFRNNNVLQSLDISGNAIGDVGAKHCGSILEDNGSLQMLVLSSNEIGDVGAGHISRGLQVNTCLKKLDVSWNSIGTSGAIQFAASLKRNATLEVFRARLNGFGQEGGLAMVHMFKENRSLREVDLSVNRLTNAVLKLLGDSLNTIQGVTTLNVSGNLLDTKVAMEFLTTLMVSTASLSYINLEGVDVTSELREIVSALYIVHNIGVWLPGTESQRVFTKDTLTRNLTVVCEFMEAEEIDVEDIFPDYEDAEDGEESPEMQTVKGLLHVLQRSGKVSRMDRLNKLMNRLTRGVNRKFLVSELARVYELVIGGKDPMQEQPLRSHLRRSIREERKEAEKLAAESNKPSYGTF